MEHLVIKHLLRVVKPPSTQQTLSKLATVVWVAEDGEQQICCQYYSRTVQVLLHKQHQPIKSQSWYQHL